ncbi:hypothetical protein WJX74_009573 [Apatococcus lobatus]|uniref:F-box domain-containing protein n=1 Tax=Apatococcus lobatus TaxID=904363 RepID=A0AAW1S7D6_9CHLO
MVLEVSDLPTEALLRIFRFLESADLLSCAGVCKPWRVALLTEDLWWDEYSRLVWAEKARKALTAGSREKLSSREAVWHAGCSASWIWHTVKQDVLLDGPSRNDADCEGSLLLSAPWLLEGYGEPKAISGPHLCAAATCMRGDSNRGPKTRPIMSIWSTFMTDWKFQQLHRREGADKLGDPSGLQAATAIPCHGQQLMACQPPFAAQACPWLGISVWDLKAAAKNRPNVVLDVLPNTPEAAGDVVAIAFEQLPWDGCAAAQKHADSWGTRLAVLNAHAQVMFFTIVRNSGTLLIGSNSLPSLCTEPLVGCSMAFWSHTRSTAACQGSIHLAIGTPGKLSLFKIVPVGGACESQCNAVAQPSALPSHSPDLPSQQEVAPPSQTTISSAANEHVPAAGSSSPAPQPDNPRARPDGLVTRNTSSVSAASPNMRAQSDMAAAGRLVAQEVHQLPGNPTQLSISWSMPPEFFHQIWRASEACHGDPSSSTNPHATMSAAVGQHRLPRQAAAASSDAASMAEPAAVLEKLHLQDGNRMRLPELPRLRKGAAQGVVPRIQLIAESYACLHVALEPSPGNSSPAWLQPHSLDEVSALNQALSRLRRRSSGSGGSGKLERTSGVLCGQDLHAWLASAGSLGSCPSVNTSSGSSVEPPAPSVKHTGPQQSGTPKPAAILAFKLAPKLMRQGVKEGHCHSAALAELQWARVLPGGLAHMASLQDHLALALPDGSISLLHASSGAYLRRQVVAPYAQHPEAARGQLQYIPRVSRCRVQLEPHSMAGPGGLAVVALRELWDPALSTGIRTVHRYSAWPGMPVFCDCRLPAIWAPRASSPSKGSCSFQSSSESGNPGTSSLSDLTSPRNAGRFGVGCQARDGPSLHNEWDDEALSFGSLPASNSSSEDGDDDSDDHGGGDSTSSDGSDDDF